MIARPGTTIVAVAGLLGACGGDRPELPASLDGLVFDTVYAVGAADGERWEVFEGLWDVELSSDGRLALLDLGGPAVHVYDASGAHVGSIDESGLAEGQLDRPSGIAWAGPGALLVWDPGSSWVSRFDVDGRSVTFRDRWRAFAFGETGFCAVGGRTFLSTFQAGRIVHEIGPEGPAGSFGAAPPVPGADSLGPELRDIAVEELTPSALLCTPDAVLDVSFVQNAVRLHTLDGAEMWSGTFEGLRPIVVYSPDGIGLGRAFDSEEGSHLLRSVTAWGASAALVQHEVRMREIPEEGEPEVFESRLIRLADGSEIGRSMDTPLVLAANGRRLALVVRDPVPSVTVVEVR